MNEVEKVSLETQWEILDQIIDARNDYNDVHAVAEAWSISCPEHAKFIKDHVVLSTYILRTIQYEIRKKLPKGTSAFHQTKIIKPGDFFS